MKKILTGALAFMLFAVSAQAQTRDTIHRHKGGHEMMANELNLTEQQKASLKSIHESERNEMKSLKTTSLTEEQQKAKRQELHKKYSEQVQAIYTPEQKEQLNKMKAEWKANGKKGKGKNGNQKPEGRKGENGFKKGNDFSAQLNLTADQKAKMEQLRNNSKTEMT
ncbi:MAG: Spy/CpxP family protein refolding chaperone, partial [Flavisolibacter sp.]